MAKPLFTVNVKTEGDKELQRVLNVYGKWNKRQPQDIATAQSYFLSIDSMKETPPSNKDQILEKLKASSKEYPDVPLDAILINAALGKKNKKGLTGEKMQVAIERFDKKEQNRTGAARSGWFGSLKQLDFWNKKGDISFQKRFAPKRLTASIISYITRKYQEQFDRMKRIHTYN
jgi:hypothetical protein